MSHAAIEREVDDNGELVFSESFCTITAAFADESLFSVHANSAHLNVNYRLLPRVFRRGSGSGTEVEGYSADITGFVARFSRVGRHHSALTDSVLSHRAVFQFATSFAPLSVQSRTRPPLWRSGARDRNFGN